LVQLALDIWRTGMDTTSSGKRYSRSKTKGSDRNKLLDFL
jgi:hypothetical protein